MCVVVLLSLILMQASRNLSDTWLAYWIRNINISNNTFTQPKNSSDLVQGSYADQMKSYMACIFDAMLTFRTVEECMEYNSTNHTPETFEAAENSYYLSIYIGIAIFNSLIALVRAFAFAYAGIRAAKFLHNRLLNSVIFVSNS